MDRRAYRTVNSAATVRGPSSVVRSGLRVYAMDYGPRIMDYVNGSAAPEISACSLHPGGHCYARLAMVFVLFHGLGQPALGSCGGRSKPACRFDGTGFG